MTWSDMTPKQRQTATLIVLGVGVAIVLAVQFAVLPGLEAVRRVREQAGDMQRRVERDELALQSDAALRDGYQEASQRWNDYQGGLPPADSPFLWVTERMYRIARECGFTVESLQETTSAVPDWIARERPRATAPAGDGMGEGAPPPTAAQDPSRWYGPYGVQVVGQAAFPDVLQVLDRLERQFPLLSVSALSVTATRDPRMQLVRMTLEWPSYLGPESDRPALEETP